MRKFIIIAAVIMFGAGAASAQDIVKSKKVPQAVQVQYQLDASKAAAKKCVWYKAGDNFIAEYEGVNRKYTEAGSPIWTSQKVAKDDVDSEVLNAFSKKYGLDYPYQWAENVTLATGEKFIFIVGKKGKYNYYFKYNDKKTMVEKIATVK
ncbi:MAG: hypothetical protein MJZ61_06235 [Bacteroidales bacterium]|nr:hypothetical protein [Bacteroidales bacterium]